MKIFADVADLKQMERLAEDKTIEGFTTNPSLIRKAGITSYLEFAVAALSAAKGRPISFEVISDSLDGMEREARIIDDWAANILVKIPIMNSKHESTLELIRHLSLDGVQVNVTAVMTRTQAELAAKMLDTRTGSIISIFAGRIADTGVDPAPIVQSAVFAANVHTSVLWASTRELLNIKQAEDVRCHIITLTPDLLAKRHLLGKDLDDYSLETVQQFHRDAEGYDI